MQACRRVRINPECCVDEDKKYPHADHVYSHPLWNQALGVDFLLAWFLIAVVIRRTGDGQQAIAYFT